MGGRPKARLSPACKKMYLVSNGRAERVVLFVDQLFEESKLDAGDEASIVIYEQNRGIASVHVPKHKYSLLANIFSDGKFFRCTVG
jgi:hypothetical protein